METKIKQVEILPVVDYYMKELGLGQLFAKYTPKNEMEIPPAQVMSLMVMNIMVSAKPLYQVEEWLHDYIDGVTEERFEASKYNDDRLGRTLDLWFEADRSSFMTELSANAIRVHQLETEEMHNDSSSVTLVGAYEGDDPKAVNITYGHNKDHRPDCKQVVFGLNVTADGHVPLSYQLYDGNQADVTTHIPNWTQLRELLGKENFIYVADSKLCSYDNLQLIAENNGQFITVVPRNVREVKGFLARVGDGEKIDWQDEYVVPDSRKKGCVQRYRLHVGESMDSGYRIVWVHSASKARLEKGQREQRIEKAEHALESLSTSLNQRTLKTRESIEHAVKKALHGASPYVSVVIREDITIERVQVGRGRPGPNTRYEDKQQIHYRLEWIRNEAAIEKAERTDGLFPLVDNTDLEPIDVLRTYKDQPFLEKRFNTQKSVLEVAPVFLETPRRIEAMMCLYFIALMLVSLIERKIRREMEQRGIEKLPMRPGRMYTKRPTWRTIVDTFHGVHLSLIEQSGTLIQGALKGLNSLRRHILDLLGVPHTIYTSICDRWWVLAV